MSKNLNLSGLSQSVNFNATQITQRPDFIGSYLDDNEHSDYMDMTPKDTPQRSFANTEVSKFQPQIKSNDKPVLTPPKELAAINSSYTSIFDEPDYTDMKTDKSKLADATPQKLFKQCKTPQRYGIVKPEDKYAYLEKYKGFDQSLPPMASSPTLPTSSSLHDLHYKSTIQHSQFVEGGYSKNNDEDYDEIAPEDDVKETLTSSFNSGAYSGAEYRTSSKSFLNIKQSTGMSLHDNINIKPLSDHTPARKRAETVMHYSGALNPVNNKPSVKNYKASPTYTSKSLHRNASSKSEPSPNNVSSKLSPSSPKNQVMGASKYITNNPLSNSESKFSPTAMRKGAQSRISKVRQNSSPLRQNPIDGSSKPVNPHNLSTEQNPDEALVVDISRVQLSNPGPEINNPKANRSKTMSSVSKRSDKEVKEKINNKEARVKRKSSQNFENFDVNYLDSSNASKSQRSVSLTSEVLSSDTGIYVENQGIETESVSEKKKKTKTIKQKSMKTMSKKEKASLKKSNTLSLEATAPTKRKSFWRRFRINRSKEKDTKKIEKLKTDALPPSGFHGFRNTLRLSGRKKKSQRQNLMNNINSLNKDLSSRRESIIDATKVVEFDAKRKMTLPSREKKLDFNHSSFSFSQKKSQTLSHSFSKPLYSPSSSRSKSSRGKKSKSPELRSTKPMTSYPRYLETDLDDVDYSQTVKSESPIRNKSPQPKFNSGTKTQHSDMIIDISHPSNYDGDDLKWDDRKKGRVNPSPSPINTRNGTYKSKTLGKMYYKNDNNRKTAEIFVFESIKTFSLFEPHLLVSDKSDRSPSPRFHQHFAMSSLNNHLMPHGFVFLSQSSNHIHFKEEDLIHNELSEKKKRQSAKRNSCGRKKKDQLHLDSEFFDKKSRSKSTSDLDDENHLNDNGWWKAATKFLRSTDILDKSPKDFEDSKDQDKIMERRESNEKQELIERIPLLRAMATKPKVHPIYPKPSSQALEVSRIFLSCIRATKSELVVGFEQIHEEMPTQFFTADQDNAYDINEKLRWSYAKGHDLVTWTEELLKAKQRFDHADEEFYKPSPLPSRQQITGMWQVLFEEGTIFHVKCEEQFEDGDFFYGFHEEVTSPKSISKIFQNLNLQNLSHSKEVAKSDDVMAKLMSYWLEELDLADAISYLQKNCHDALFRKALQKLPEQRTCEELKMIYEEIIHIKPIVHLSDSVKRELAGVIKYEFHHNPGTIVFKQGDEGTSWYIILHGSVKVDIIGKGIVCTLNDGDDFGNLALVNDAPRSASIVTAEENCHFLKVDKNDFNRILKDVEANTVRLKEHGNDVLVLQKIRTSKRKNSDSVLNDVSDNHASSPSYRYSVTAGTPEAIIEHILEYLHSWKVTCYDETLEEFILMHLVFMSTKSLLDLLLKIYRSEDPLSSSFEKSMKRKVVYFVVRWSRIMTYEQPDSQAVEEFLRDIADEIEFDGRENLDYLQLRYELCQVYSKIERTESLSSHNDSYLVIEEYVQRYQTGHNQIELNRPIRKDDEVLLKVYNCEKVYTTIKVPVSAKETDILNAVSEKTHTPPSEMKLMEVQECGDIYEITNSQPSVVTSISLNSVLSVCDHCEKRTYLENLRSPTVYHDPHFDAVCSMELAYYITEYDWQLVNNVHVMEYVYKVFRKKFQSPTLNLDILSRRFNQLAYWPPTEICSCTNIQKRANMLRKFIKVAHHMKTLQNMNAFMALMIGIVNSAVTRLHATWEKLPAKYRKQVQEYERILDPSRNHRNYRLMTSTLEPPFIPYLPLLSKDMTFQHEGNDNKKQNLINFEKMRMISSSIKTIIRGCSEKFDTNSEITSSKTASQTRMYARNFKVITDQKKLNELSAQIEPKR